MKLGQGVVKIDRTPLKGIYGTPERYLWYHVFHTVNFYSIVGKEYEMPF